MYDSLLFEQFITDIRVMDLGQTVVIDCCPSGYFENDDSVYQFTCLECEEIKLNFNENMRDCIDEDGCIDLLEFSVSKQNKDKKSVYIYGRVISLSVICKEIKIVK